MISLRNQKEKNKTAEQIVHYLCKRYGLDYSEHDAAYILKMVNMRYAMGLNSYQQWLTTVLASDVSDATAAAIMENQDLAVLFFILFCNFHHNLIGTCDKLRHTIRRECAVSKCGKIIQLLAVLCNRLILSVSQNILNKRMCKI